MAGLLRAPTLGDWAQSIGQKEKDMHQEAINFGDRYLKIIKASLNSVCTKGKRTGYQQLEVWGDEAEVPKGTKGYLEVRFDGAFRVVLTDRKPPQKRRRKAAASGYSSWRVSVADTVLQGRAQVKQTAEIVVLDEPGGWHKFRSDVHAEVAVDVPSPISGRMSRGQLRTYIKQLIDLL